ncbi:MAG TPA: hypothetical protein VEF03_12705 [Candidatus Binataceae bacterium]|nr:hypothetical protein [Candidatus Binataceae bacterium]
MEERLNALQLRVERLERSNRTMKIALAGALAIMIAIASVPQAMSKSRWPHTLVAEQFALVNEGGQVLAALGAGPFGNGLVFFDPNGKPAVIVGTNNNPAVKAAGVAVLDGNSYLNGDGVVRAAIGVGAQGAGSVALDRDQHPVFASGVNPDGSSAGALVMDSNGYARAGLMNGAGGTGLFIKDANNVTRMVFGTGATGSDSGMAIFDAKGAMQMANGGVGDDSAVGMTIFDSKGQDRLDAGLSSDSGAAVIVKDEAGKPIATPASAQ